MKVINLFGGPGIGKSTMAAGIFYHLKRSGVNCEYVHEEAKEFTWEDRQTTIKCQPYIFAKQMRNLWRIQDKVDVAITDSPILLSLIYADDSWPFSFEKYVIDQFLDFDNVNIVLTRKKEYSPIGRNQTQDQAKDIDENILYTLKRLNIPYFWWANGEANEFSEWFLSYFGSSNLPNLT